MNRPEGPYTSTGGYWFDHPLSGLFGWEACVCNQPIESVGSRELTQDYHAIRTVDDNQLNTGDIFNAKTSSGIYSCYYHAVTIAWEYIGSLTLTSFLEYYNCYGGAAWEERAS